MGKRSTAGKAPKGSVQLTANQSVDAGLKLTNKPSAGGKKPSRLQHKVHSSHSHKDKIGQ